MTQKCFAVISIQQIKYECFELQLSFCCKQDVPFCFFKKFRFQCADDFNKKNMPQFLLKAICWKKFSTQAQKPILRFEVRHLQGLTFCKINYIKYLKRCVTSFLLKFFRFWFVKNMFWYNKRLVPCQRGVNSVCKKYV